MMHTTASATASTMRLPDDERRRRVAALLAILRPEAAHSGRGEVAVALDAVTCAERAGGPVTALWCLAAAVAAVEPA